MAINNKKITELVGENYVFASVLYYFGIKFYDYSEKTLEQVCTERGLDIDVVISRLESIAIEKENGELELLSYPIDLIIEYLKHAHYIFIKQKLPYIARLIENLQCIFPAHSQIIEDLKFVFPLFVEDFIHHIYEEEDSLFCYINLLNNYLHHPGNLSLVFYEMEKFSLQEHAIAHDMHDDEMEGIRSITNDYRLPNEGDLHLKVVFEELKSFEKQLIAHAGVENEILFPKALLLEKEVKCSLKEKIRWN